MFTHAIVAPKEKVKFPYTDTRVNRDWLIRLWPDLPNDKHTNDLISMGKLRSIFGDHFAEKWATRAYKSGLDERTFKCKQKRLKKYTVQFFSR